MVKEQIWRMEAGDAGQMEQPSNHPRTNRNGDKNRYVLKRKVHVHVSIKLPCKLRSAVRVRVAGRSA
jgi:hypothetical protein